MKHIWETENRMVWHIEYSPYDTTAGGITVWESVQQGEEVRIEEVEY